MQKPLHICAIPGVNDPGQNGTLWNNMASIFMKVFPGATFEVEKCRYYPLQHKRMQAYADALVAKHDHGQYDLLLLGHSAGGIIATSIASRFKQTKVVKVVALCSPFTFFRGFFSRLCGPLQDIPGVPIVTIQARHDWVVWHGTRHPHARKHTLINCGHLFGLENPDVINAIAEECLF